MIYPALSRLFPQASPPPNPQRIVIVRPCCIGDVVMATAALGVLRRAYPNAHITWAVGGWSRQAVAHHPALNAILDTGAAANPAGTPTGLLRFANQLRAGQFDLAVSLVRSPLVGVAVWLSGIPHRAGIDSAGRGFGYNIRAAVNPTARRHEVDIYLDVVHQLVPPTAGDAPIPHIPVTDDARDAAHARIAERGVSGTYMVVNPSGGKNPGAQMDAKRYPPPLLAQVVNAVAPVLGCEHIVIVAGPGDDALVAPLAERLALPHAAFVGDLTFREVGALAAGAVLYLGNDTGLTHLAAAAGAPTAMILGPTDPARYAPYAPNALALWQQYDLPPGGFSAGTPPDWDWQRDGIPADACARQITAFLAGTSA